jgi:mycothione reductase
VAAGGLKVDEHGHLVTDDAYRTPVPGVWAFGDIANHFQLKHMANAEERVVLHNLTHPDTLRRLPSDLVPRAVFSDPQVASVGLTEQQARRLGIDYTTAVRPYADTAYGWALEDTSSLVKLIADPHARTGSARPVLETLWEAADGALVLTEAMALGRHERGHKLGLSSPDVLLRPAAAFAVR